VTAHKRRPSKAALQRAYERERREFRSRVLASVVVWLILEPAGGHFLMPKAMGVAVFAAIGNAVEIPRALRGE
jgi:hypothetical protein